MSTAGGVKIESVSLCRRGGREEKVIFQALAGVTQHDPFLPLLRPCCCLLLLLLLLLYGRRTSSIHQTIVSLTLPSVARPSPSRKSSVAPLFQSVTVLRLELLLTELIHCCCCCCCCYAAIVPSTLRGGYYKTLYDVDDDDDDECSSFLLSMQYVINK